MFLLISTPDLTPLSILLRTVKWIKVMQASRLLFKRSAKLEAWVTLKLHIVAGL
jgi:hypothetical protein